MPIQSQCTNNVTFSGLLLCVLCSTIEYWDFALDFDLWVRVSCMSFLMKCLFNCEINKTSMYPIIGYILWMISYLSILLVFDSTNRLHKLAEYFSVFPLLTDSILILCVRFVRFFLLNQRACERYCQISEPNENTKWLTQPFIE